MVFSNKTTNFKNKEFRESLGETIGRFPEDSIFKNVTNDQKKKLYKIFMTDMSESVEENPYLINSWTVWGEDFERKKTVTVFERSKKAMQYIEENMKLEATWNQSPYDCSGRWYLERASVKVLDDRIIVKQVECLDV